MPFSAAVLLVGGLALAGLPPFSLFISEFYILYGGLKAHYWLASGLFILFLVIIFGGLTYHFIRMVIGPAPIPGVTSRAIPKGELFTSGTVAMAIPLVMILILAWWIPTPLLYLLHESVRIITGGSV